VDYISSGAEKIAEIDTEDLGKIEDLLDHVIASKNELRKEVEELIALKEDLTEYQEVSIYLFIYLIRHCK